MARSKADIAAIFKSSESVLEAKLKAIRSAFHHAGMKGTSVEAAVSDFLREILPKSLAIGSGIVIDSDLNASRQIDIIIYDAAATPTFFSAGGMILVPIECVYFAIEVKTKLSRKDFDSCARNMISVKALDRRAYYTNNSPSHTNFLLFGEHHDCWQTIYLVIALESDGADTVLRYFHDHRRKSKNLAQQIDAIFCLDTAAYVNGQKIGNAMKYDLLPWPGSQPVRIDENALLSFLALFSRYYNQAKMGGSLDFTKYVMESIPNTATVIDEKAVGSIPYTSIDIDAGTF